MTEEQKGLIKFDLKDLNIQGSPLTNISLPKYMVQTIPIVIVVGNYQIPLDEIRMVRKQADGSLIVSMKHDEVGIVVRGQDAELFLRQWDNVTYKA
jgi:hypothetical protein